MRKRLVANLIVVLLLGTGILFFPMTVHAINTAVMSWSLMDSGKHLDWDGNTTYISNFNAAVNAWNVYKPGVIRADTIYTIEDVTISDFYEVSNVAGKTTQSGTISFNTYLMQGYSASYRLHVCEHELGHALGLDENQAGDVMYAYVTNITALSANDKASYDLSYSMR